MPAAVIELFKRSRDGGVLLSSWDPEGLALRHQTDPERTLDSVAGSSGGDGGVGQA